MEIDGQRYDGPGVNDYRGVRSLFGGAHPGKWPFLVDRDDIRAVFFRDPAGGGWSRLEWEHAAGIDAPFSADAARYVRGLATRLDRHVDPRQAVQDLLTDWAKGEVTSRRDRNLALRLAAQRTTSEGAEDTVSGPDEGRAAASTPGVVDLLTRLRKPQQLELRDDLDDVFARYYATHPDGDGLEVFDE